MKKLLTFGAGALLVSALVLPAFAEQQSAQTAEQPPVLSRPIKMAKTDRPVVFPHAPHTARSCTACHTDMPRHFPPLVMDAEQDCVVCHHLVEGQKVFKKCSSAGCHDVLDRKDKSVHSYYRIFHDRSLENSCLSCHARVIKTRPEKRQALTSCVGSSCHPKS